MINTGTELITLFFAPPGWISAECLPRKMMLRDMSFRRHPCQGWCEGNHSLKIKKMKIQPEQVPFSHLPQIQRIREITRSIKPKLLHQLECRVSQTGSKQSNLSMWIFNDFLIANICHGWACSSWSQLAPVRVQLCVTLRSVQWGTPAKAGSPGFLALFSISWIKPAPRSGTGDSLCPVTLKALQNTATNTNLPGLPLHCAGAWPCRSIYHPPQELLPT